MGLISFLFGRRSRKIQELLKKGAVVIDVRTKNEFSQAHAKGSRNVPLDRLDAELKKLKKAGKPIVACCASGMRSGVATKKLQQAGIEAINGGSWNNVKMAMKDSR